MELFNALKAHEQSGKTIRVGLVGAGQMGEGFGHEGRPEAVGLRDFLDRELEERQPVGGGQRG